MMISPTEAVPTTNDQFCGSPGSTSIQGGAVLYRRAQGGVVRRRSRGGGGVAVLINLVPALLAIYQTTESCDCLFLFDKRVRSLIFGTTTEIASTHASLSRACSLSFQLDSMECWEYRQRDKLSNRGVAPYLEEKNGCDTRKNGDR